MIENKNNRNKNDDEVIRHLIQSTHKKAPDDLKFRVMHNIEMDEILLKRYQSKKANHTNPLKDFWSIFGMMYLVMAFVVGIVYFTKGIIYLQSIEMIGIVIFISFVFSLYWLLTKVEDRYRRKMYKK